MSESGRVVEVSWKVAVVCTDRGAHRRVRITDVSRRVREDGTAVHQMWQPGSGSAWWNPPDPGAAQKGGESRTSYEFRCPRCGRHVQVRADRWWSAVKTLVTTTDLNEIDVSLLS